MIDAEVVIFAVCMVSAFTLMSYWITVDAIVSGLKFDLNSSCVIES